MSLGNAIASELKYESVSTRKMLERVPADKFDWQPHGKSMTLGRLATHVAELPGLVKPALTEDELDFAAGGYKPRTAGSSAELVGIFDETLGSALELLEKISDREIMKTWRLRSGEHVIAEQPRLIILRSLVLNHLFHHRGQLSVYLRLNDVPLPSVYGPTADEPMT